MDFLKEWEEKLHIKITCSQVFHRCILATARCYSNACMLAVSVGQGLNKNLQPTPQAYPWGLERLPGLHSLSMIAILVQETEPMGTAGPLRLASDILDDGSGDPFFVLNRSSTYCAFLHPTFTELSLPDVALECCMPQLAQHSANAFQVKHHVSSFDALCTHN